MLYIWWNIKSLTILQPATCPPAPTVTVLVLCIYSNTISNDGLTSHGGLTATVTKQPYLRHFYMCVRQRAGGRSGRNGEKKDLRCKTTILWADVKAQQHSQNKTALQVCHCM